MSVGLSSTCGFPEDIMASRRGGFALFDRGGFALTPPSTIVFAISLALAAIALLAHYGVAPIAAIGSGPRLRAAGHRLCGAARGHAVPPPVTAIPPFLLVAPGPYCGHDAASRQAGPI
jgi:hypothetical protein